VLLQAGPLIQRRDEPKYYRQSTIPPMACLGGEPVREPPDWAWILAFDR